MDQRRFGQIFMELKVYSGYRGHRNFTTPATLGLRIARGHCARPRLCWYN